jgi:hypothetical protein
MTRRGNTRSAFRAVRAAIGAELKKFYFDVLQEPIPDRMAELVKQLDRPPENGQNTGTRSADTIGKILDV